MCIQEPEGGINNLFCFGGKYLVLLSLGDQIAVISDSIRR